MSTEQVDNVENCQEAEATQPSLESCSEIDKNLMQNILGITNASTDKTDNFDSTPNLDTKDTNEKTSEESENNTSEQAVSRELKLLLALSKEAKLDTNISHKRKTLELKKDSPKSDKSDSVSKQYTSSKTSKPVHESRIIRYPVTAESELELDFQHAVSKKTEENFNSPNSKTSKRKRDSLTEASTGGATDEGSKKIRRKSLSQEIVMFKPGKDMFCWRCHRDGVNIACETCVRTYHIKCLKQTIRDPEHWPCPECVSILKAESTQTRSETLKGMTLEHLCGLLKYAVNRMIQCQSSEPFIHPVSDGEFPAYKKYIIQPMDLTLLEKNIKENLYGSPQAFEADAKWILHNSIIFNSYQSKLTTVAKNIIKICKQEMAEIENCPSCYLNANTKKKTWFVEVCPKPHLLVWAKLKGFPYWPAKAMSCKEGMVDVRFFGAHDRAWVPYRECYVYSEKDPNTFKQKRSDIEECIEELHLYVDNLKKVYGEFCYAPFKTFLDPNNLVKQLQILLPTYKINSSKNKIESNRLSEETKTEQKDYKDDANSKDTKTTELTKTSQPGKNESHDSMEGYGTDDESIPEINSKVRNKMLNTYEKFAENKIESEITEDEDDTQVPSNVAVNNNSIRGNARTRGGFNNFAGKLKILPLRSFEADHSQKRESSEEPSHSPQKLSRRNSEASVKSDLSRVSSISDKINRVDISENMEITLGNDDAGCMSISENISSNNSESSRSDSDFNVEIKRKPVQVDIDNAEFTISPSNKLKIAEKLMKRLSDGEESSPLVSNSDKVEEVKRNVVTSPEKKSQTDKLLEKFKDVVQSKAVNFNVNEPSTSSKSQEVFEKQITDFEEPVSTTENIEEEEKEDKNTNNLNESEITSDETVNNIDEKTEESVVGSSRSESSLSNQEKQEVNSNVEEKTIQSATNAENNPENVIEESNTEKPTEEQNKENSVKKTGESTTVGNGIQGPSPEKVVENGCSSKKMLIQPSIAEFVVSSKPKEITDQKNDEHCHVTKKTTTQEIQLEEDKEQVNLNPVVPNIIEEFEDSEEMNTDTIDDSQIDQASILNIIHSSLNNAGAKVSDQHDKSRQSSRSGSFSDAQNETKKRKYVDNEELLETRNKLLKLVPIESILKTSPDGTNQNTETTEKIDSIVADKNKNIDKADNSMLLKSLQTKRIIGKPSVTSPNSSVSNRSSIQEILPDEIKSEPESDTESSESENLEAKRKYLSALNISEKGIEKTKPSNEIRTRSKTEEKREKFKVVDNLTRVIDEVAVNYSADHDGEALPKAKETGNLAKHEGEIFVKSFAKILPKQRARKSFPVPNYTKPLSSILKQKEIPKATTTSTTSNVTAKVINVTSAPLQKIPTAQTVETIRTNNGYIILPQAPTSEVVILPPNQTISFSTEESSKVVAAPKASLPTAAPTELSPSVSWQPIKKPKALNVGFSQNYIPQNEVANTSTQNPQNCIPQSEVTNASTQNQQNLSTNPILNNLLDQPSSSSAAENPTPEPQTQTETMTTAGPEDEFSVLNSLVPENVSRAVSELLRRPPPQLKPRPPGMLSTVFSECVPSSAGSVTTRINSVAHRLGDYFRGMLIETLEDLGKTSNPEATITSLKLEIEALKHKNKVEISEIEKNVCTILKDIQRSIVEDRERIIDETRASCESEAIRRIEEAKSKQWCANCTKEAQFYCCWNTSYCDYPCQQKHWPQHMSKCTQSLNQPIPTVRQPGQQIILRPANPPPKGGMGRVLAKPLPKVYMNRNISPKTFKVQTTSGGTLTMMETTPGNYQVIGNPITVRPAPMIAGVKTTSVLSVTSPSNNANFPKIVSVNQSKSPGVSRMISHKMPVTTMLGEDSDS